MIIPLQNRTRTLFRKNANSVGEDGRAVGNLVNISAVVLADVQWIYHDLQNQPVLFVLNFHGEFAHRVARLTLWKYAVL